MFSYISQNWRGKPLTSYQAIINLIAATETTAGLKIYARLHDSEYAKGITVSDTQMDAISLDRHEFHGDWNYTISPSPNPLEFRDFSGDGGAVMAGVGGAASGGLGS